MQVNVIPGKTYAVSSSADCTVTCEHNGRSYTLCTASGGQAYFVPPVDTVTISDDTAIVTETFNVAPQQRLTLLGVLGGNAGGSELPKGWTRVEYLESTGTQYIDTGEVPKFPLYWEFTSTAISTQSYYSFLAGSTCTLGDKILSAVFAYSIRGKANDLAGSVGIWCDYFPIQQSLKEKNVLRFEANEPVVLADVYVNNIKISAGSYNKPPYKEALEESTQNVYLFARNMDGIPNLTDYVGRIRLYEFRSLGAVKQHLVPCRDKTGAPCLYDKVSKKAFYNKGTGDFLYPTESTTYSLRRILPDWGKLTEHGLCRLYHAPANYTGELYDYALEHGYKPIIEPEMPEDGYWVPQWRETEDEIILEWVETEPPVDEFLTIPTEQ